MNTSGFWLSSWSVAVKPPSLFLTCTAALRGRIAGPILNPVSGIFSGSNSLSFM